MLFISQQQWPLQRRGKFGLYMNINVVLCSSGTVQDSLTNEYFCIIEFPGPQVPTMAGCHWHLVATLSYNLKGQYLMIH